MIPGDLLSAFPHRQFHTRPGLLDSWAALPNSNPKACMPMQRGSLYHFYDGLWYDPAERRTHDLPCERRTRYRLSQPDTVKNQISIRMMIGKVFFSQTTRTSDICYKLNVKELSISFNLSNINRSDLCHNIITVFFIKGKYVSFIKCKNND